MPHPQEEATKQDKLYFDNGCKFVLAQPDTEDTDGICRYARTAEGACKALEGVSGAAAYALERQGGGLIRKHAWPSLYEGCGLGWPDAEALAMRHAFQRYGLDCETDFWPASIQHDEVVFAVAELPPPLGGSRGLGEKIELSAMKDGKLRFRACETDSPRERRSRLFNIAESPGEALDTLMCGGYSWYMHKDTVRAHLAAKEAGKERLPLPDPAKDLPAALEFFRDLHWKARNRPSFWADFRQKHAAQLRPWVAKLADAVGADGMPDAAQGLRVISQSLLAGEP